MEISRIYFRKETTHIYIRVVIKLKKFNGNICDAEKHVVVVSSVIKIIMFCVFVYSKRKIRECGCKNVQNAV